MGAGRWWLCGHGEGTSAIETLKTQWHTCNKTNSDVTTCGNKWGCLQPLDHWIWLTNSTAVSGKMPCSWKIHPSNAFSNVWQGLRVGEHISSQAFCEITLYADPSAIIFLCLRTLPTLVGIWEDPKEGIRFFFFQGQKWLILCRGV